MLDLVAVLNLEGAELLGRAVSIAIRRKIESQHVLRSGGLRVAELPTCCKSSRRQNAAGQFQRILERSLPAQLVNCRPPYHALNRHLRARWVAPSACRRSPAVPCLHGLRVATGRRRPLLRPAAYRDSASRPAATPREVTPPAANNAFSGVESELMSYATGLSDRRRPRRLGPSSAAKAKRPPKHHGTVCA